MVQAYSMQLLQKEQKMKVGPCGLTEECFRFLIWFLLSEGTWQTPLHPHPPVVVLPWVLLLVEEEEFELEEAVEEVVEDHLDQQAVGLDKAYSMN